MFVETLLVQFFFRYKNRPHMSFDDVAVPPDQEFELHRDETGTLEYPTKYCKF